jgi:RNA polymerase-binding transcription factor DksA
MRRGSHGTYRTKRAASRFRRFEALLRKERAEIQALLATWQVAGEELGGYKHTHPADVAGELYDHEDALSRQAMLRQRLTNVDAALERTRTGTFGRCEACGEPIEVARLEAVPTARRRVACQEWLEQQERLERQAQRTFLVARGESSRSRRPGLTGDR